MNREEFNKKWISIQNEMVVRMSNKAIGMGELEKFFTFVNELISNKNSLEEQNADLTQQVKEWKMALHIAEQRIKELEKECEYDQRNAAMSQRESGIHLDKIVELENKIKELEEPKTCEGCTHISNSTRWHDCPFEDCSRYANLRGFPDMYKLKQNQ